MGALFKAQRRRRYAATDCRSIEFLPKTSELCIINVEKVCLTFPPCAAGLLYQSGVGG